MTLINLPGRCQHCGHDSAQLVPAQPADPVDTCPDCGRPNARHHNDDREDRCYKYLQRDSSEIDDCAAHTKARQPPPPSGELDAEAEVKL